MSDERETIVLTLRDVAEELDDAVRALETTLVRLRDLRVDVEQRNLRDPGKERAPKTEPLRPENPDEEAPINEQATSGRGQRVDGAPAGRPARTVDLNGCARCDADGHRGLVFERLDRPVVDDDFTKWEWWAPCPTNGQPILLADRAAGREIE